MPEPTITREEAMPEITQKKLRERIRRGTKQRRRDTLEVRWLEQEGRCGWCRDRVSLLPNLRNSATLASAEGARRAVLVCVRCKHARGEDAARKRQRMERATAILNSKYGRRHERRTEG